MPTAVDYPGQLQRTPMIDIRSKGAIGDGVHDDTPNIQAALDAAGTSGQPCGVFVPRPPVKWRLTNTLKFKHDGIVLQGVGMIGIGLSVNNIPSVLWADPSFPANSPVIQIDSNDNSGGAIPWYRGTAIENISVDVSSATVFTSGTPGAEVIRLRGLSNCPESRNICVYGGIGTGIQTDISRPADTFCENLRIVNSIVYGGYNASGGSLNTMPTAPMVKTVGCDNIQFLGGLWAYNFGSLFQNALATPGTPIGPPVQNNLTDVPAFQVIPGLNSGGGLLNLINNGIVIDGVFITNSVVSIRVSNITVSGTTYCPAVVVLRHVNAENYNKFVQVNQEVLTNANPWRTTLVMESCSTNGGQCAGYGGSNNAYAAYAPTAFVLQGANMQGGSVAIQFLRRAGDITLSSTTNGVTYEIGPTPDQSSFFSATDSGTNQGIYRKNSLPGSVVTGQLRVTGSLAVTDPATFTGTYGNPGVINLGDTFKMAAIQRSLGIHANVTNGTAGDMVWWFDGTNYWIGLCVQDGAPGTWVRFQGQTW